MTEYLFFFAAGAHQRQEPETSPDASILSLLWGAAFMLSSMIIFLVCALLKHCQNLQERYSASLAETHNLQERYSASLAETAYLAREVLRLRQMKSKPTTKLHKPTTKLRNKGLNLMKTLINDKNIMYYTGLESIGLFKCICNFVSPFIRQQWRAGKQKEYVRKFKGVPKRFGFKRFLNNENQLLMTLMRLRRGLGIVDLAHRFNFSQSGVSRCVTTWIAGLAKVLGPILIRTFPQEVVVACKPKRYRHLPNLMGIIDCTELFIETPTDMDCQSGTWSDYKHHNTAKVLLAILPNGLITFISKSYMGRLTDDFVTVDSGYLATLPPGSQIMADRGFLLQKECWEHNITIIRPTGRRGVNQFTSEQCMKSKKVANLRILVEQVIGRLKTFTILKNELSIRSLGNLDDILVTCAALTNLRGKIYD